VRAGFDVAWCNRERRLRSASVKKSDVLIGSWRRWASLPSAMRKRFFAAPDGAGAVFPRAPSLHRSRRAQHHRTNTFGANRFKLAPLGLGDEVQRLNSRGVKIAREARESAARRSAHAGSIGPLGLGVQSRHPEPEEIQDIFHEQALALEERGVDFYILETFSYIEELMLAV